MPKIAKELTALQVKRIEDAGYHAVGGVSGLYLQVTRSGAKTWVLRAKVGGKRCDIGLGGFPTVTLAQARENARTVRDQIQEGIDPVQARKAAQEALKAAQARYLTFEQAARKRHTAKAQEFSSEKHRQDWIKSLEMYAFPIIGERSIEEIDTQDVLKVLQQPVNGGDLWHNRTETATRVRQRMHKVFSWAIATGHRNAANPAEWAENLEHSLSQPSKIMKVKHFPALAYKEVPELMKDLEKREGVSPRALEFLILTAVRSSEVRFARWDEIDLDQRIWTIPAERIKARKTHRVPLSDAAVNLLEGLPRDSEYLFPNTKGNPLSDAILSVLTKKMREGVTPHGFRSSFKDWARSCTSYADEVSELALAHVNSDSTRAAYARDELLPQRKRMMTDWAVYLGMQRESANALQAVSQ